MKIKKKTALCQTLKIFGVVTSKDKNNRKKIKVNG
jgi:hypothetical protein